MYTARIMLLACVTMTVPVTFCFGQADPPPLVADPPPLVKRVASLETVVTQQAAEIFELKSRIARLEGGNPYQSAPRVLETFPKSAPPVIRAVGVSSGHTHTCANGHPPVTWGELGHGHNCPACGAQVTEQDSPPRGAGFGALQYGSMSAGCANGQCDAGGASASGLWFPGKKLIGRFRGK